MDFFIKKIFDGKSDELVHLQFQKYSRGNFTYKAMIKAKNSKGAYSVGTSYEYSNELVRALAEKLGSSKTKITGVIVSTRDLTGDLNFSNKKQFMGVKQYVIDSEMSGNEIVSLCEKLPNAFFALSFSVNGTDLKVRPKSPKSAKPSSKADQRPEADFCKLKTDDKNLVKSLLFDVELDNFKLAEIDHTFVIDDIEIDHSIKDPLQMREKAKRKGKIVRNIIVDERVMKEEKKFVA